MAPVVVSGGSCGSSVLFFLHWLNVKGQCSLQLKFLFFSYANFYFLNEVL
jgi:hypothetical protein